MRLLTGQGKLGLSVRFFEVDGAIEWIGIGQSARHGFVGGGQRVAAGVLGGLQPALRQAAATPRTRTARRSWRRPN